MDKLRHIVMWNYKDGFSDNENIDTMANKHKGIIKNIMRIVGSVISGILFSIT